MKPVAVTEKIGQLTEKQFEKLRTSRNQVKKLKEYAGIDAQMEYILGDSAVMIPNSELYGIYRNEWKGRTFYYLVASVLSEELAFAWNLYPAMKVGG